MATDSGADTHGGRRRCESSSTRSCRWRRAQELEAFFRDLCTLSELEAMAHRWEVARLLEQGLPYVEIAERTGGVDDDGDARGALAASRRGRLPDGARPRGVLRVAAAGQGPAARAGVPAARGRRARAGAARRPRARVPVPERAGRGAARPRRRHSRSTCRTASSTAASPASTSSASAAPTCASCSTLGFGSCRLEAAVPEESDGAERSTTSPA